MSQKHLDDPAIENATRVFLLAMTRFAAAKHPQRTENPVPAFESLGLFDRTALMRSIHMAVHAHSNYQPPAADGAQSSLTGEQAT